MCLGLNPHTMHTHIKVIMVVVGLCVSSSFIGYVNLIRVCLYWMISRGMKVGLMGIRSTQYSSRNTILMSEPEALAGELLG